MAKQGATPKAGDPIGYYILVRSAPDALWEADWDGTLYFSRVEVEAARTEAENVGYEAVATMLMVLGKAR